MDNFQNQNIPPVLPPQQQNTSSNISWLKTLSIGFSLVSLGIAIGIGGYVLGTKKNQSVSQDQQVASPTPLPAETSVKEGDPTANPDLIGANWKTYTNNGYTVKYPDNLTLNTRTYKGLNGGTITIDEWSSDKKDGIAIYSYAEGIITGLEFNAQFKEEQILLAGISTKKYVSIDDTLIQIGPLKNNNMEYMIVYTSGIQKPDHTIFDQILSTFKFTDQK